MLYGSLSPLPANSRAVHSNQQHTHPKLPDLVRRHLAHPHQKPVATHSLAAFEQVVHSLKQNKRPIILDSFCGTGQSTATLALRYPGHLVVGVDKSAHRLGRHIKNGAANYLLSGNCCYVKKLQSRCTIFSTQTPGRSPVTCSAVCTAVLHFCGSYNWAGK